MDFSAEIEHAIEEMERGELLSTVWAAIDEILADTPNPPPLVPAELELNTHPQPVESQTEGYGACIPMMADLHMFEQQNPQMTGPTMYDGLLCQGDIIRPSPLYSHAGVYSEGQYIPYQWPVADVPTATAVSHPAAAPQPYLPYQWPVADVPTATAVSHPAAAPQPCNIVPVVKLSEGQSLRWVGVQNGEMLYEVIADDFAPPLNTSNSRKRKRETQQDESRPYVKKPPNAFILFMKEQRLNVEAEFNIKGMRIVAVNRILGQKWKSLTEEEQAKYYDKAKEEKRLHAQQHPEWTTRENYGKKRKRQRKVKASAFNPEEDTQQAKKLCGTPVQTAVMETSSSLAEVRESSSLLAEVMETSSSLAEVMESSSLLAEVMETSSSLAEVKESSSLLAEVMETSSTLAEVMESSSLLAEVMETSSSLAEVMESSSSLAEDLQTVLVMEAPQTQTVLVQLPHTQTAVTPVCDMCHLPQVYEVSPASWLNLLETASTSLASPAPLTVTQSPPTQRMLEDRCYLVMEQLEPPSSPHCAASAALL